MTFRRVNLTSTCYLYWHNFLQNLMSKWTLFPDIFCFSVWKWICLLRNCLTGTAPAVPVELVCSIFRLGLCMLLLFRVDDPINIAALTNLWCIYLSPYCTNANDRFLQDLMYDSQTWLLFKQFVNICNNALYYYYYYYYYKAFKYCLKLFLRYDMAATSKHFALLIFVIVYRRFGIFYRSLEHGTDRASRNVSK